MVRLQVQLGFLMHLDSHSSIRGALCICLVELLLNFEMQPKAHLVNVSTVATLMRMSLACGHLPAIIATGHAVRHIHHFISVRMWAAYASTWV